jgi:hypothetical protein
MAEKSEIDRVIVESMHVDDEGYKDVKTFSITEIQKLGIVDVPAFLAGLLDAENDNDFNESSVDYVKGFRYGKTGKF